MPAPKPNAEAERPRSLFMVRAAKLTLTRSRYATKKHTIRNGTKRAVTFAMVRCSNGSMFDVLESIIRTSAVREGARR